MRTTFLVTVAALLASASMAAAQGASQTTSTPAGTTAALAAAEQPDNYVEIGVRGTSYADGSDEARYQRYRDLRDGVIADIVRMSKDTEKFQYRIQADHVGYRDQRYSASYNKYGKVKMEFEWNQIPVFFSQTTSGLYNGQSAVQLLPDSIQTGLQNKTITLNQAVAGAVPFDVRLQRDIAAFKMTYSATPHFDININFRNTTKQGTQPWAGTYGFSDAVELAAPVDTRTTELGTAAEWSGNRGSAHVGYDGSFFHNNNPTLVWDNPLRVTDSPTLGPVQGRESLWPNSDLNAVNVSGVYKLAKNTNATGYLSVGDWTQNNALIPFTINTALPVIPLARATSDAKARVTSSTFSVTSRPSSKVWMTVRFRNYDFNNQTDPFKVTQTVSYDTTPAAFAPGESDVYSFDRKRLDAEAAYEPMKFVSLRAGYEYASLGQTFRTFDSVTDNMARLSADLTGNQWVTVRAVYEHTKRSGSGLDEQSLDDIGEQTSLRQFDISSADVDRFSTIFMVTPVSSFSITATAATARDNRPESTFGLQDNNNDTYSVGFDYVPTDNVSAGLTYTWEKNHTLQRSRSANPGVQFDDPTRDWTTDGNDHAKTIQASLDLLNLGRKVDARLSYDRSDADSLYLYGLAPNTTLPPVVQLPNVNNTTNRAIADFKYHVNKRMAAGFQYYYEKYETTDYALNRSTLNSISQPSFLMLGYTYQPYTANTLSGRLTYYW